MAFSDIPATVEGRAVPVAAFELALTKFSKDAPEAVLSERQQDVMLETIIELVSGGITHIDVLADRAIRKAAQMSSSRVPAGYGQMGGCLYDEAA